jgi:hypothetical protein
MISKKYLCLCGIFMSLSLMHAKPTVSFADSSTEITGTYSCVPNPCDTDPCLPGVVWTVVDESETNYHLTVNSEWLWGCEETSWNGYVPEEGDLVIVVGEVSEHSDTRGHSYYNIEVEALRIPCVSEKIYGEYSEEVEFLRYFRDNSLNQTPEGRELIKLYYQLSPVIVRAMEKDEEFKKDVKEMIDGFLPLIEKAGE